MYRHGSTCLSRTVSGSRAWCPEAKGEESLEDSGGCLDLLPSTDEGGELRLDLIARVRQEIADGTYDTPEKLEVALERLLDRLDLA